MTLEVILDLHRITLTLIVPAINLLGSAVQFNTIAIRTTHNDSIVGPSLIKGALQTYEAIELQGTASFVVF